MGLFRIVYYVDKVIVHKKVKAFTRSHVIPNPYYFNTKTYIRQHDCFSHYSLSLHLFSPYNKEW